MSTTQLNGNNGEMYLGEVVIDASGMTGGVYQIMGIDVDVTPDCNAKLTGADISFNDLFYFKTDSLDVGNADVTQGNDIRVFFNSDELGRRIAASIDTIGTAGADVSANQVLTDIASGTTSADGDISGGTNGQYEGPMPDGGSSDKSFGKDIVRYMAWQLTNGYANTDVFSNEDELLSSISTIINHPQTGVKKKLQDLAAGGQSLGNGDAVAGLATGGTPTPGAGIGSTLEASTIVGPIIKYMDVSNDWVQFLTDLSGGDADGAIDWTPIPITKDLKLNCRVVIKDIAGTHHDGTQPGHGGAGGAPAAGATATASTGGGTNQVGDRSYNLQLTYTYVA